MNTDLIISEIASELGVAEGTIAKWRTRRKVPHHMRHQIADAALDRGYLLRTPAFDGFGAPAAEKAA